MEVERLKSSKAVSLSSLEPRDIFEFARTTSKSEVKHNYKGIFMLVSLPDDEEFVDLFDNDGFATVYICELSPNAGKIKRISDATEVKVIRLNFKLVELV